ncbi:cohesin domain-containing protein, partial [Candidatus Chloroploca sp. Khr17]|uniref:cohesin domain-containing protein n=1 Tax=Candidatus Chloroploca sp. Khr17 TaxID=2496869 RepID=UPI00196ADC9E
SDTQPIDGAAFFLDFDPTVLDVVSVTPNPVFPIELIWRINQTPGQLDMVRSVLKQPFPQGTFHFATVTFRARQAAPDGTSIQFSRTADRQTDVTANGASVLGPLVPTTLTVRDGMAVQVQVQLEGEPRSPDPRLSLPLAVTLRPAGSSTPVYQGTPTLDQAGRFQIEGLAPGAYTLSVKHPQTLRAEVTQELSGDTTTMTIGPLPSGDANNDNRVSLPDFSVLASTFGRSSGSTGYDGRADFSGDGVINLRDFSLLAKHFNAVGAADPSPAEPRPSHSVIRAQQVVPNLTAGASVTLDVAVHAPPTGLDGAAVTLAFDPTVFEVLAVTGDATLERSLQQVVDPIAGRIILAQGTLNAQRPTGQVPLAQIQLRARTDAATTAITLVDDGEHGQSAVTAGGQVVPLAATAWRLTLSPAKHTVYLPVA